MDQVSLSNYSNDWGSVLVNTLNRLTIVRGTSEGFWRIRGWTNLWNSLIERAWFTPRARYTLEWNLLECGFSSSLIWNNFSETLRRSIKMIAKANWEKIFSFIYEGIVSDFSGNGASKILFSQEFEINDLEIRISKQESRRISSQELRNSDEEIGFTPLLERVTGDPDLPNYSQYRWAKNLSNATLSVTKSGLDSLKNLNLNFYRTISKILRSTFRWKLSTGKTCRSYGHKNLWLKSSTLFEVKTFW